MSIQPTTPPNNFVFNSPLKDGDGDLIISPSAPSVAETASDRSSSIVSVPSEKVIPTTNKRSLVNSENTESKKIKNELWKESIKKLKQIEITIIEKENQGDLPFSDYESEAMKFS